MGLSFASIHILNSKRDIVYPRISQIGVYFQFELASQTEKEYLEISQKITPGDIQSFIEAARMLRQKVIDFYVFESNKNFSIFSNYICFPYAKDIINGALEGLDNLIISSEYFDDSIANISIYRGVNLLTSFCRQDGYKEISCLDSRFDIDIVSSIFNCRKTDIESAYDDDMLKTCLNFADIFGLPLCMNLNEVIYLEKKRKAKHIPYVFY